MPFAAPSLCQTCKQPKTGICQTCAKPTSKGWNNDETRIRGRKLQRLRANLFASEPFCRVCMGQGRERLASIRDHIIPLAEGGTDDLSNVQAICSECHDLKVQQEANRGKARSR